MTRLALLIALAASGVLASGCATVRLGPDATGTAPAAVAPEAVEAGRRLFPARLGARWGYIDASGAPAIAARFDDAQPFSEGRAGVRVGSAWGYIDPAGAFVVVPEYASVFPFENGRGRVVAGTGREALVGFVGPDGAAVVRPSLAEALNAGPGGVVVARAPVARVPLGIDVLRGLGLAASGLTPWLVLGADGRTLAEARAVTLLAFGDAGGGRVLAPFRAAGAVPGVAGAWGFVDAAGAVAVAPQFRNAAPFSEGRARVSDRSRFGFADGTGAVVIPLRYEQADSFSEGLAAVRDAGVWGFVRPDGTTAIAPRFEAARGFTEGLAAVKENGLWGYVRPDGTAAIAPRFAEAAPFHGALARVTENGAAAYVDASGRVVWREAPPAP